MQAFELRISCWCCNTIVLQLHVLALHMYVLQLHVLALHMYVVTKHILENGMLARWQCAQSSQRYIHLHAVLLRADVYCKPEDMPRQL